MQMIPLNTVTNKETKYYGLKVIGLIFGVLIGMLVLAAINMTTGIIACVLGYAFGSYVSNQWHQGKWQRWLYWHLPSSKFFGGRYLPPSYKRTFM